MTFNRSRTSRREPPERWQREDDAPRLRVSFENLQALRLELTEWRDGQQIAGTRRIRHIIVDRASTHFEVPCGDPKCTGGGHDISSDILRGLRQGAQSTEGEHFCSGYVADRDCGRQLHFTAVASFRQLPESALAGHAAPAGSDERP